MDISNYDQETRRQYVAKAKKAAFLDAVFLIHYYNNEHKRWGPEPKPEDITPGEVFTDFDEEVYDDALRRAHDLLAGNGLVGMAFHKYQSVNISYEEALQKFYEENPGFSDKCYALAVNAGLRDMR